MKKVGTPPRASRLRAGLAGWVHRRGMLCVVIVLLAWLWGTFLWFAASQKRQLLIDRGAELGLLGSAVAQHASSTLRSVESDLRALDAWISAHPGGDPAASPAVIALAAETRRIAEQRFDLSLVWSDGRVETLGSRGAPLPLPTPAASGSGGDGALAIGQPQRSADGRWRLPVWLAATPSGADPWGNGRPRLAALMATIDLHRLAADHDRMRHPSGTVTLLRTDGLLLSRAPLDASFIGKDFSRSPYFASEYGRQASGAFVSDGKMTDQVARLVAYERLDRLPLTVLVSRGIDEIYTTYYRRVYVLFAISGLLSVVALVFTWLLHRSQAARLEMLATQERLLRLATTDELTGVTNRRAFSEAAQREFERALRYERPTAVLALDIDHFKRVNDEYGHAGGDLVLQACATRWQAALRDQDLLGRIGGEEFAVLLPETNGADAACVAERLRAITAATPVLGVNRSVSVSVGWTVVTSLDKAWCTVMERADQALYQAKAHGRNRVHPPAPAKPAPAAADRAEAH